MSKTKIFVIYHIPEEPIISDVYQPISVGRKKNAFPASFLRDDIGENISDKNPTYNEMTAIYWVFKHVNELDCDYIGFAHYRRLFCFSDLSKTAYVRKKIDKSMIEIDNSKLERFFKDYDLMAPYPNRYKSVRHHYEKAHNKTDVDLVLDIIRVIKPNYYKAACEYFYSSREYSYNMFVMKKNDFIEYGSFIFDVLGEFEKMKKYIDRLYISERLTGVFISYLLSKQYKVLHLPVIHIRKKSFKKSLNEVNENFKENKNNGFFYKTKSMFLHLMPICLEQALRRYKTK